MIENIYFDESKRKWFRICPVCKNEVYHTNRYRCNLLNRKKILCQKCSIKRRFEKYSLNIPSSITFIKNKWKRICPICKKQIPQQSRAAAIINLNNPCRKCCSHSLSEESKNKISIAAKKRWGSLEFREKMNVHLQHMRNFQIRGRKIVVSFNPNVCVFLDKLNSKGLFFFRHQRNHPDGEFSCLGYFADGYDEKQNVWFEYDEPHHEVTSIKKNDKLRERRLIGKLKCRFIRYSEKTEKFYEVLFTGKYKKVTFSI